MLAYSRILLSNRLRSLKGAVRSGWQGNRLKLIAGVLTVAVIAPSMYLLFDFLFSYLTGLENATFGEALARRLLGMALMTFGIFIAVSSLITGISTLFRSGQTSHLLSLPVPGRTVAFFRTFESWFYAGWATLLLGVPIVIAYAGALQQPVASVLLAVLLFPFFVAIWLALGTLLLGLFSRLGDLSTLWRAVGGVVLAAAAGIVVLLASTSPQEIVIPDASATETAIHRFVSALPATGWSGWPHALYSSALANLAVGQSGKAAVRAFLLLLESAVVIGAALTLICRGFRRRFAAVGTGRAKGSSGLGRLLRKGNRLEAVWRKDLVLFFRDPIQWSQLGLLGGLFILYAANLRRFPMDFSDPVWLSVAVFMNISFAGFVTATLLVRFAFPAVSLEGPGLHVLLQVPGGRSLLFSSKWLQSFGVVLPFMVGTVVLSAISIGAGLVLVMESAVSLLVICIVLVSINVSLGSIYPDFGDNNAANIASGQGGIISAFVSTGYVLVMVAVLSFVTRSYLTVGFHEEVLVAPLLRASAFSIPLSAALAWISVRLARRSLRRRDFAA
jgi:ABC-2 type transport system permease protein